MLPEYGQYPSKPVFVRSPFRAVHAALQQLCPSLFAVFSALMWLAADEKSGDALFPAIRPDCHKE